MIKVCDNVDCKNPEEEARPICLTKEFDYDYCMWCDFCISRDREMVLSILHE